MHDELSIARTLNRYSQGLDGHLEAHDWLEGFTSDAELVVLVGGVEVAHHRGRDELRTFHAAHRVGRAHRHLVLQPIIEVTGDHAKATSSFVLLGIEAPGPSLRAVGRYDDDFCMDHDGTWRLRHRTIHVDARADGGPAPSWESIPT